MTEEQKRLIAVARGCLSYGGGYRNDPEGYDAFQHGISTVIRALESAVEDSNDPQVKALENEGTK